MPSSTRTSHNSGRSRHPATARELDVVITTLEQSASGQDAARRTMAGQYARQRALYSALRINHMQPIAAIAAARRRQHPELDAARMPSGKPTPRALIAAAEAIATVVKPQQELFIDAGLSADFVEQLEAAAQSLADIITDRATTKAQRTGATAALQRAASRGRRVLAVLGSMIQPQLANDPALLAEWKTARHILRPPTARPIAYELLAGQPAVPTLVQRVAG